MFYIMCIQIGAGFQMMVANKAVSDFTTMIIVSFPVMVAILISFAPVEYGNAIPNLLKPILTNGFVMGIISVLLLENLLCRENES